MTPTAASAATPDSAPSKPVTLLGKISFRPSHYSTLVQYGYTIESNILTDFSGGNFSYSFRINHNGETPKESSQDHHTHTSKTPIKSLKIKLWKLELKTVRKSVQFQKKLLIKLKVTRDEWERNAVSEWKISAGDILLEIHEKSPVGESVGTDTRTDDASQALKDDRRKSALNRSSLTSTRHNNGNLFNSIQLYHQQQKNGLSPDIDAQLDGLNAGDAGRKLDRIEASAQTLIVAIQKRPNYRNSLKKHRLSTTNITKNLFSDANGNGSASGSTSPKDDIALRRRSLSSPANTTTTKPPPTLTPIITTTSISPPPKSVSAPRKSPTPKFRRTPLKIIANDDVNLDTEEGTPQTPASPNSVRSSVDSLDSFAISSTRSDGIPGNRNSDSSIPKWAQRALSPASTPSTMKKQRFVDRVDPESYAYIMYFIQGSQEQCFTSFTKFCSSILFVGAGSPSHNPFSVHFSSLEDGSQYSLTERLFRMEQHNSRVTDPNERYRLFVLQLPTYEYANEQWVMAHLRQASMIQALCSPIEGLWKKPLKHLNSFKTCPTIDNTSVIMNESIVEFNKVLRYERIQFGVNMLKIAYVRAQGGESIELDLDVKWLERDRRRGSISESVRIMDSNRYKLYFSKNDQQILSTIESNSSTMNL